MEIWISKGNDRFRLPVLPSNIVAGSTSNNKTIDINARGEVMLLGNEDLRELSIESFFPNKEYPFVEYTGYPKPWECVSKILGWKASKEPLRLVVTGTILNMEVGIEDFRYGEQDGSGDVYYSLALKDYRRIVLSSSSGSNKKKPVTKRPTPTKPSASKRKTYIVKRGDNLWNIAKKQTGNAMNYKKIAKDNKIKNPNKIYPGMKLII